MSRKTRIHLLGSQTRGIGDIRDRHAVVLTAVPIKLARIVSGQGNRFQHRVDAKLGHDILHVGADRIHGEVQLFRYNLTVRGTLRQAS